MPIMAVYVQKWVKIRAWHAAKSWIDPQFAVKLTYCGRMVEGVAVDDLPAEKSCESCLRIIARLSDA